MDQQIHAHLLYLEDKLEELRHQLNSPTTPPAAIPRIKEDIQMSQDAIEKLRRALELEQQFNQSKSPAKPGPHAQDQASRKPKRP